MVAGGSPRALNRSTCSTSASSSGVSSTYQSGVFDTSPPSQYGSSSMVTGANPGGSAPLAITCSGPISFCSGAKLSK